MRYDDPANVHILNEFNAGHTSPSLLNVEPGQLVEVKVADRTGEDYIGN